MVITEDWYFLSHRISLAQHMSKLGWEVLIATQVNSEESERAISSAGLRLVHIGINRGKLFAMGDVLYWWRLVRLYRQERPDVVHHVAMKPVLYGSLAAALFCHIGVINSLAGMGYLFTSTSRAVKIVRSLVMTVFRRLFSRSCVRLILQNGEDAEFFGRYMRVPERNIRLIRGAGVDIGRFRCVVHGPRERPVVVMISRMLRDKGVLELVKAAEIVRAQGVAARILFVGGIDVKNPNSFTQDEMEALNAAGVVEWVGHKADVGAIYEAADIAVLPSYREGLPKSLLEAAACGLPIVTTDTSGCREVVASGVNGLLVPVRDVEKLAQALARLIMDPELRARMGANSRTRAETEFHSGLILDQTEKVYAELIVS